MACNRSQTYVAGAITTLADLFKAIRDFDKSPQIDKIKTLGIDLEVPNINDEILTLKVLAVKQAYRENL